MTRHSLRSRVHLCRAPVPDGSMPLASAASRARSSPANPARPRCESRGVGVDPHRRVHPGRSSGSIQAAAGRFSGLPLV